MAEMVTEVPRAALQNEAPLPSNVHVSQHPVLAHKMTAIRDLKTVPREFRRLLREISFYLGYEATAHLGLADQTITTPMGVHQGQKLSERIAVVPILRAGLGMSDSILELLPNAAVHHIGMYRSKHTLLPVQYYNRLPRDSPAEVAFVLDPCIATSGTARAVVSILKRWGARKIIVVALIGSRPGVEKLAEAHPDVPIYIGDIDSVLSETGMIIPGLGDAGDRLYGTPSEEVPVHADLACPSSPLKRQRANSDDIFKSDVISSLK